MNFDLQPILQDNVIKALPLQCNDFERLFEVASDPLIWEQHPSKDRYKREGFETFFKGAIESGGAFLVLDNQTDKVIGSSRFYDHNEKGSSVLIGYTFFARDHWGSVYNPALKKLMLDHAFQFVDSVIFHIGASNVRSQKAIERLGAVKIDELQIEYYGESSKLNFVYEIRKENWNKII